MPRVHGDDPDAERTTLTPGEFGEQPLSRWFAETEEMGMRHIHASNPEDWVDHYGDCLFRFALLRVHAPEVAQDLVQETFLAALQACDRFAGRSAERTWLIGILKHKIIDYFRRTSRESVADDVEWAEHAREDEGVFKKNGHWNSDVTAPQAWPSDPSSLLEQKEFWKVLNQALSEMPSRMAKAFLLREVDGLSTEEICDMLNITPGNLSVILHRARKYLRRRLESHLVEGGRESLNPLLNEAQAV